MYNKQAERVILDALKYLKDEKIVAGLEGSHDAVYHLENAEKRIYELRQNLVLNEF